MDTSAFVSIRNIVNKARGRAGVEEKKDPLLFGAVMDGMVELSLFNLPQKNSVKVTLDNLGRIAFPLDCLKFLSLSVPSKGREFTFTKDTALVTTSTKTYSSETLDADYGDGVSPDDNYNVVYSKGGSSAVYFTLNERLKYAQIVNFKGQEATLNYVSSGIASNPEGVEINKIYEPALIAYAVWKVTEYDTTLSLGERQMREKKFFDAAGDLDMVNYSPTKDQIMDQYFKHLYQTVKR